MTIVDYCFIYEDFESTLNNHEVGIQIYQNLRCEETILIDCCQSLQYAEKQQAALEKYVRVVNQEGASTSENHLFSSVFWKHPPGETHDCFRAIANYAMEYHEGISPYQNKSTDTRTTEFLWEQRIRKAMSEINRYPITTMLFPVLLVSYIADSQEYQTIYPRMKYNKTKFPRNKHSDSVKNEMENLYRHLVKELEEILCDLVSEEASKLPLKRNQIPRSEALRIVDMLNRCRRTKCDLNLPVISPSSIAEKLSNTKPFENSSEYSNKEEIEEALRECLSKNGRSYRENQKAHKPSAEIQIIYAVAKLCNANSFVYFCCGEILDHNVSGALNCLLQHGIISSNQAVSDQKTCELQLYQRFCKEFSIYGRNLTSLAFYKYCRPMLSFNILYDISFFDELLTQVSAVIVEVSNKIRGDFGMPFWWSSDALTLGRKLSDQFCQKLTKEDIREFVSKVDHFEYDGFLQFLHQQCKQHGLDIMEKIPSELEVQIVPLIFDDILRLVSASIVDLVRKYCNQKLEAMLS